jgi:hypothetical protein
MVDERRGSISIGARESDAQRATRAVLGDAGPARMALAEVLKAHEVELTEWLREPGNRERLMFDPVGALAEVIPPETLKVIPKPPRVKAELVKELGRLEFRELPARRPAQDLFDRVWAYVADSPANLAAFTADVNGAVAAIDPSAPAAVVDEVIAALDLVRGIQHVELVDSGYFASTVSGHLAAELTGGLSAGPQTLRTRHE